MARYMLTIFATWGAQQAVSLNNIYFYESNGQNNSAANLITAWESNVHPSIMDMTTAAITYNRMECVNLDEPGDFHEQSFDAPPNQGVLIGDSLPPFVCWRFQYMRATRLVRHGWKRFAGVPEAWVADGVISGHGTEILALETALGATIVGGLGLNYEPKIARRIPVVGQPTEYELFPIAEVAFRGISSQNSRKFGRGV